MKPLTLKLKKQLRFRLDGSFLSVNNFKNISEFKKFKILYGNKLHNISSNSGVIIGGLIPNLSLINGICS